MNGRRSFVSLCLLLFALAFASVSFPSAAWGQASEEVLKARMADRLRAVDALRAAGKAGENNKGLLAARTKLADKEVALIKAENEDRKAVYTLIGEKTGKPVEVVGAARAAALRELSKAGVWLQNTKGDWYRKQ